MKLACSAAIAASLAYPGLASPRLANDAAANITAGQSETDAPTAQQSDDAPPLEIVPVPPAAPSASEVPPPAPPPAGVRPPPAPAPPPFRTLGRAALPKPPPLPPQRPVTDFVGSEEKLKWFQSPAVFFPAEVKAGGGVTYEGETFFTAPLAWAVAGKLASDVSITIDGKGVDLKAGTVLPQVTLRTEDGTDQRYIMFCTRNRTVQEGKIDFLTSMFGKLANGLRDAQWCLQDSDNDGLMDLAVVLNAGAPVSKADDIEPIAVETLFGEKIDGDGDTLSMRLERVGKKSIQLYLDILQEGAGIQFQTLTSRYHRADRYSSFRYGEGQSGAISMLGFQVRVVDADRKENWAQLEWGVTRFGASDFVVIPTRVTYY